MIVMRLVSRCTFSSTSARATADATIAKASKPAEKYGVVLSVSLNLERFCRKFSLDSKVWLLEERVSCKLIVGLPELDTSGAFATTAPRITVTEIIKTVITIACLRCFLAHSKKWYVLIRANRKNGRYRPTTVSQELVPVPLTSRIMVCAIDDRLSSRNAKTAITPFSLNLIRLLQRRALGASPVWDMLNVTVYAACWACWTISRQSGRGTSNRWQKTSCADVIFVAIGSSLGQRSNAFGHRGWKRHPEGGLIGLGISPRGISLWGLCLGSGTGIADIRATV